MSKIVESSESADQARRRGTLLQELCERIAAVAGDGEQTAIPGVLVSRADAPTEPMASRAGTIIALIAQGSKRLALGERLYEYEAGEYLVASVDLPITGHYVRASLEAPALGFGLILRPAVIGSLLLEADGNAVAAPARPSPAATPSALGVAPASLDLLDAVVRMLRLLDSPGDAAVLAPLIEREILWRVLGGPLGPIVRQIGTADSSLTQISDAVRWISEHYSEPFAVEELAARCAMSVSAFHGAFRAVTATSPVRFQKQIRLHEARLLLLGEQADVAGAGFRVGYRSTTQFSREYRRQFGLPPGRDAARLRSRIRAAA